MENILQNIKEFTRTGMGAPILVIGILAMIIVPLPPVILDLLFSFNISFSLIILLACVYAKRPLDFEAFPTILLVATLLRLALNIASTRVILMNGHTGTDSAGAVIKAFGEFVIGGSYTVGIVIFSILVIINFMVVTKGAGRVSEVTARFTLDAMPGKQMAIDADLNAGLINAEEALRRRTEVVREADFYGAMDGSSKFVRGDAIAGILILFINIFGGFAIGVLQHGMSFGDALKNYTLLTIGEGLVTQIPSLILSTAAAIMVTRVSSAQDMGQQISQQIFSNSKILYMSGAMLGVMGLIPGMPHFSFFVIASIFAALGYLNYRKKQRQVVLVDHPLDAPMEKPQLEQKELSWDDVVPVDMIGLEVGYRLIPLVQKEQGGQLMPRIKGIRKKLTQELGFLIPSVHIRDNLELSPNVYRITLKGVSMGEEEVHIDKDLAINPGNVLGKLEGIKTKDPAFDLEAVWVNFNQRDHAQTLGYTVVDTATVIATHLSQILKNNAHELLGREEVQNLLSHLTKNSPKLVEDLVPKLLSVACVSKILQNLLLEDVPIKDFRTIAETLAEYGIRSQDPDILTAQVRIALARTIVQHINGKNTELEVFTLDHALEQILQQGMQSVASSGPVLEPKLSEKLQKALSDAALKQEIAGKAAVLLVAPNLRALLTKFARHSVRNIHVLSFHEIPDTKQVRIIATIRA